MKHDPSARRSSLLEIIKDSSTGENPHRAAAMELVFERAIHDCQNRMLTQPEKSSQVDSVAQSKSRREATSTFFAAAQPTTAQPSPPVTQSRATRPLRTPALQTQQNPPKMQPSLPQKPPTSSSAFSFPSTPPKQPQMPTTPFSFFPPPKSS